MIKVLDQQIDFQIKKYCQDLEVIIFKSKLTNLKIKNVQ